MRSVSQPQVRHLNRLRMALSLGLFVVLIGLAGCGAPLVKSLLDLAQLRAQLMAEFHEKEISVNLGNATYLNVTFLNSALNDGPPEDRAVRAQATALFVRQHYPSVSRVERIVVLFVRYKTQYVFMHSSYTVDLFLFDRKGQRIDRSVEYGGPPPKSNDRNGARDEGIRKQADGGIEIQLSGDMNNGLALFPLFDGADQVAPPRRAPAPKKVIFTFASYAREKVFNTDIAFAIIADGKTIFQSTSLNTSKDMEGGNEFLTQEVPFTQFLTMVHARQAILKLDQKEYPLTTKQLAGLRDMANQTTSPRP